MESLQSNPTLLFDPDSIQEQSLIPGPATPLRAGSPDPSTEHCQTHRGRQAAAHDQLQGYIFSI